MSLPIPAEALMHLHLDCERALRRLGRQYAGDHVRQRQIGGGQPKVGQCRQLVQRMRGVIVALQRLTRPCIHVRQQRLNQQVIARGLLRGDHVRIIRRTPQQIAQEDLWWWNLDIAERLPAGAIGAVDIAPGDGTDRYTVSVTWSEAGFATPQSYAVTFDR